MNSSNDIRQLQFSDRKKEVGLFRRILENESSLRGLIIHSDGQGGIGKSTLLKMFENECRKPNLSLSPQVFYFNADRLINWKIILDRTVKFFNNNHFQDYISQSTCLPDIKKSRFEPAAPIINNVTHIHGNVQGSLHSGSGDINMTQFKSVSETYQEISEFQYSMDMMPEQENIANDLTFLFLKGLNQIPEPVQIVWLVDAVEKLDSETESWLIEMFWQIVESETDRLILVAAGRNKLRYEPHWMDRVEEILLGNFDKDVVVDMFQKIWPDNPHADQNLVMAELLIEKSGGKPLEVIMQLANIINKCRGSYA